MSRFIAILGKDFSKYFNDISVLICYLKSVKQVRYDIEGIVEIDIEATPELGLDLSLYNTDYKAFEAQAIQWYNKVKEDMKNYESQVFPVIREEGFNSIRNTITCILCKEEDQVN